MKHLAAYMLAVLGGKETPSVKDVKAILAAVDIEADEVQLEMVINEMHGKDLAAMMAQGSRMLVGGRGRWNGPFYPGTSARGTAYWGPASLKILRDGRFSVEEDLSSLLDVQHDVVATRPQQLCDPHFGSNIVACLRKHSFALVQLSPADSSCLRNFVSAQRSAPFFPVSGGRLCAHIPVHPNTSSAVLPKIADSILEAMFVELYGQGADSVRQNLSPCFSSTRGLEGSPSTASLLTSFKCPNVSGYVNTRAHEDRGLLTLALSDRNDGLQCLDSESERWINVEAAGCVVVMAGRLLPYAAPGVFDACRHRVLSLPLPRASLTYKVRPSREWRAVFPPLTPTYLPKGWTEGSPGTPSSAGEAATAGELMDEMPHSVNAPLTLRPEESAHSDADVECVPEEMAAGEEQALPRSWQPVVFEVELEERRRFTCRAHAGVELAELGKAFEGMLAKEHDDADLNVFGWRDSYDQPEHLYLAFSHGGQALDPSVRVGEVEWDRGSLLHLSWQCRPGHEAYMLTAD